MTKKNLIWLAIVIIGITCFFFGCDQKTDEGKVVARVNNYVMTTEDLKDELMHSYHPADRDASIDNVLDLAIRKQVLIQEAQRQGLDRKKSFMKTIERYWEQTLIKELLQQETQKVYDTVSKDKQDEALHNWIEGLYKNAKIEIYEDAVKELEEKNKMEE